MAWIESHDDLRDHPKTDHLMDLLGITRRDAVGLLHFVWWRALKYVPSGDLSALPDTQIARWAEWEGDATLLVDALIAAGFLDEQRVLHDWHDYAGRWIERREANAKRMREARASHVPNMCDARAGATGPNLTKPNLTGDPPLASQGPPVGDSGADAPTPTKKPKGRKSTGKTSPPETFEPSETDYAAGMEVGLGRSEVDAKVGAMLDYFKSKAEQRADWHATFRTWLRKSVEYDRPGRARPSVPPTRPKSGRTWAEVAATGGGSALRGGPPRGGDDA